MAAPKRLAEIRVVLERVAHGEKAVPSNVTDHAGLLTKLGGDPDWLQGEETPTCPHCDSEMSFVGQIDSIEHDSKINPLRRDCLEEQDYMFGDVGLIYVFFCFDCCHPEAIHQCY
jgi:hypothetical protein